MEKQLQDYLKRYNIKYTIHEHPAVFTVEEADKVIKSMPQVMHTKNLFLKDENNKFFLVCMNAYKKLDLKSLKEILEAKKKLTFASSEELKVHLNLTSGSVSIFGMIHAKNVFLIVDREIYNAKKVGFHPNINTATLELNNENFKKYYNSISSEKIILNVKMLRHLDHAQEPRTRPGIYSEGS
jgi:Ala-tRNA(Pro) deacylase